MPGFVISAEDLVFLNKLAGHYPRPLALAWINRGTNQKLRPSTVALLMRTLYKPTDFSDSIQKLHRSTGLRMTFGSDRERDEFAAAFRGLMRLADK